MANALSYEMPRDENPLSPIPTVGSPAPAAAPPKSKKNGLTFAPPAAPPQSRKMAGPAKPQGNALGNMASAFMPQQRKPDAMYAFMDTLQRTVDPAGAQARETKMTADQQTKLQQGLAFVQQMKAIPADKRMAFAQQGVGQFGLGQTQFDPNGFTDEALAMSEATLSAQLGQGPTPKEFQYFQGQDGAISQVDKGTGNFRQINPGTPKAASLQSEVGANGNFWTFDPSTGNMKDTGVKAPAKENGAAANLQTEVGGNGNFWTFDPTTGTMKDTGVRAPAKESGGSGSQGRYRPATPEEAARYGAESGQINDADGRFYPGAKPTNPGKPTASQDDAAFFAQISLNGLNKLNELEATGYNRAGVGEQVAGSIVGGSAGQGEKERLYDNAMLQFIDGYLRAMTGAAASPAEIDNYMRQWAPQWGDSPAVVRQKAQGRAVAVEAMKRQAGPAWKPDMDRSPQAPAQLPPFTGSNFDAAPPPGLPPQAQQAWTKGTPAMRKYAWDRMSPAQKASAMGGAQQAPAPAAPQAQASQAAPTPPQEAISELMSDPSPEAMAEFDDFFGAGAAQRAMNGSR